MIKVETKKEAENLFEYMEKQASDKIYTQILVTSKGELNEVQGFSHSDIDETDFIAWKIINNKL